MPTTHSGNACCLSWTVEADEATTKIDLRGEFDLAALPAVSSDLQDAIADASGEVVVDVGQLAFIDSTGLRFLLELKRITGERGVSFFLRDVSAPVRRVLEVTGVSSLFEIEDSSDDGNPPPRNLKAVG